MTEIAFDSIPASLRLPGVYVEFNSRLAGTANINYKLLLLGQRLTAGSAAAGTPVRVPNDPGQIDGLFGTGSMLADMGRLAKAAQPWLETWAIPLDENGAGAAATGTVTFTGPATAAGTVNFYIAGKRVQAAVAVSDTAAIIATAMAAAITADTSLPLAAAVNGGDDTQVDLTCKWKGETGNDIDLRFNYYDEELPAGVGETIVPLSGGTANPDIGTAIAALGDEWWNWIGMPYTDAANLTALETELDDRWGPMRQIGARAFTAYRGTSGASATFGDGRNNPHVTCMGTATSPSPPWRWAAVNAAVAGHALSIDPARQLRTLALPGILPPALAGRFDDTERNTLLFDGISTYTIDAGGVVRIEAQITMYQENAAAMADTSYLYVNTPETLERYRFEQRALFLLKFPRHKLAKDTERVGPGQPVMQPKLARVELLALYRTLQERGWVQDYESYQETLIAQINGTDPNRLDVYDSPILVGNLRVMAVHVEFRTQ